MLRIPALILNQISHDEDQLLVTDVDTLCADYALTCQDDLHWNRLAGELEASSYLQPGISASEHREIIQASLNQLTEAGYVRRIDGALADPLDGAVYDLTSSGLHVVWYGCEIDNCHVDHLDYVGSL